MNYAIIDADGLVVNVIEWDGVTPWLPPADHIALPLIEGGIGWTFAAGQFIAPSDAETVE